MTGALANSARLFRAAALGALVVVAAVAAFPAVAEKSVEGFAIHDSPMPIPELEFQRGDGSPATLENFRGKVVLLNIWATWCIPCRKEMPTLDRLQAKLGGPGFEVLALSIDRAGVGAVRKFYEEIGVKNLAIYIDGTGKATRTLKVVGLPTTLLIDADGREIGRLVGPAEWDAPEMISFIRKRIKETRKSASG
ncbi:MAG: TlpA family protein disulfide reductase [Rhodospirillales bacterium]|nr:TlpA family protein disulfide reductase [Rhodospirillales bacterium]